MNERFLSQGQKVVMLLCFAALIGIFSSVRGFHNPPFSFPTAVGVLIPTLVGFCLMKANGLVAGDGAGVWKFLLLIFIYLVSGMVAIMAIAAGTISHPQEQINFFGSSMMIGVLAGVCHFLLSRKKVLSSP